MKPHPSVLPLTIRVQSRLTIQLDYCKISNVVFRCRYLTNKKTISENVYTPKEGVLNVEFAAYSNSEKFDVEFS